MNNSDFWANSLSSHVHSVFQNYKDCSISGNILKTFYFPKHDFAMYSKCFKTAKLHFWRMNNSEFLANSSSSHVQSVPQNSGFEVFLLFTVMTSQCTQNALKQIFSKTQLVNGVQLWFSGLKFFLTWPISAPKPRNLHYLEVFLKTF